VVVMYKGDIVEQGNVWDIFTNPQHPYTKGLLACRPPLDKRYTFLPTVSDFMKVDENGTIIENNVTVEEFTKDLIIPTSEREKRQKELFEKEPLLQIKNLKTYFPILDKNLIPNTIQIGIFRNRFKIKLNKFLIYIGSIFSSLIVFMILKIVFLFLSGLVIGLFFTSQSDWLTSTDNMFYYSLVYGSVYALSGYLGFISYKSIFKDLCSGINIRCKSNVKAVDDVTFDVYTGETLGLVGESGCGKTTTGRTIIRLEEPTDGEMIYKGKDIAKMNAEELRSFRKEVQIIFQDPYSSLNPRMTIGNAIMEPMQVHGILENDEQRKKRVEELLARVSLDPSHFYRYPHEFSGGQRQRIGIARALAVNPKFIICDESVSALDVSVQAQVLNLLNELKEEFGLTYIFISHDLSVVKYMSDRMVVMQEGRIEEMGDADQIYNKPGTEYTKKLIDAIPEGKLEDIKKHLESKGVKVG
ncbi:MAG: ABC transporter ATP-binding protein, partial [Flavobacteriales bacterium]|nr:ABC transporter ATP-binding protein [Flavobacteriales bacterium]